MKKYLRIKKNSDFQKLFHAGKKGFSHSLTLLYRPSDALRMGVCVSKKQGKGVKRNRLKRLLRAAFIPEADKIGNYSLLLVPKTSEEYSFNVFSKDLKSILRREKLYKK